MGASSHQLHDPPPALQQPLAAQLLTPTATLPPRRPAPPPPLPRLPHQPPRQPCRACCIRACGTAHGSMQRGAWHSLPHNALHHGAEWQLLVDADELVVSHVEVLVPVKVQQQQGQATYSQSCQGACTWAQQQQGHAHTHAAVVSTAASINPQRQAGAEHEHVRAAAGWDGHLPRLLPSLGRVPTSGSL